jgi:hypothetical protein
MTIAELKIKTKEDKDARKAIFTFTYQTEIPVSNFEDFVKDSGTDKITADFKGRTDQDLVEWIREIINEWHEGDPVQFIDDWELYRSEVISFDIKKDK